MIRICDYRTIGTVACTGTRTASGEPGPGKLMYAGNGMRFVATSWGADGSLDSCEWQCDGDAGVLAPGPGGIVIRTRSVIGVRDPSLAWDGDPFAAYRLQGAWLDRYLCADATAIQAIDQPRCASGTEEVYALVAQPIGGGRQVSLMLRPLIRERKADYSWQGVFDQDLGCLISAERINTRSMLPIARVAFSDFISIRSVPLPRTIITTTFPGANAGEAPSSSVTASYSAIDPIGEDRLLDRVWQPPPGTKVIERNG